jgi:integrase
MAVAGEVCFPVAGGLDAVKRWAKQRILTEAHLLQTGQIAELEGLRAERRVVMLAEVLRVYLSNVPPNKPDYIKNAQRLKAVLTEATGLDAERLPMEDGRVNRALLLGWVRMRQEYFRKGWSVKGAAPADAWDKLRADLKAGKLPGVDKTTVMEGNTTILSYLRCAKAVFANQREYLTGLILPELREFLAFSVDVAVPEGHREIPAAVLAALLGDLGRLREEAPRLWAFVMVCAWTGARPVQVIRMRGDALTRVDGVDVLVVPTAKRGVVVRVPINAGTAAGLRAVLTAESLVGAKSPEEALELHRAVNKWMTGHGAEGTHKSYLLRHMRGQQMRDAGGLEMSAAVMGHKGTAMAARKYTESRVVIPMLDPWGSGEG